jgi:hypothetical protein
VGEVADREELFRRLTTEFGLPRGPAERYAAILVPDAPPIDRAVARLLKR